MTDHIPHAQIQEKLNVTEHQIQSNAVVSNILRFVRLTDNISIHGSSSLLPIDISPGVRSRLLDWNDVGDEAIHTAFKLLGYARRKAVKKGFSDDPEVMRKRVAFAEEGLTWDQPRLYCQMFSDEVWANGGAHTMEYITVKKDSSEKLDLESIVHKYSKLPAWMFYGTITGLLWARQDRGDILNSATGIRPT
ncbi:hypothetical protein BKA64DRAFT_740607 [Cadophora sp. MPI-SDFR-AT-0126]|nr:hypothetical protein BKA64DRAFT_740607 [Leotiomycetes sp. MPI-SDFR-AT-0126]